MRFVHIAALIAVSLPIVGMISTAEARTHHHYKHHRSVSFHHHNQKTYRAASPCAFDNNGRTSCQGSVETSQEPRQRISGNYGGGTIVAHPAGCPRTAFCGCGVALKVWGKVITRGTYAIAAYWKHLPRTSAAAGMVAVFGNHHVAYIESIDGNGNATLYDPNSGGHQTRLHTRSIRGATIVNPHGTMAMN